MNVYGTRYKSALNQIIAAAPPQGAEYYGTVSKGKLHIWKTARTPILETGDGRVNTPVRT